MCVCVCVCVCVYSALRYYRICRMFVLSDYDKYRNPGVLCLLIIVCLSSQHAVKLTNQYYYVSITKQTIQVYYFYCFSSVYLSISHLYPFECFNNSKQYRPTVSLVAHSNGFKAG
jgi:branched-subunit amino acid transport protein AzlD